MTCFVCRAWVGAPLCGRCLGALQSGRPRLLSDGLAVYSAFVHDGSARTLVHRLKYEGIAGVAGLFARALLPLLPQTAEVLIPVPRVVWRRVKYGIDPALEIATALARLSGLKVDRVLAAAPLGSRHAGHSRADRNPPWFGLRRPPQPGSVLIDDVVTTGGTLTQASRVLGGAARVALTASSSEAVTSLRVPGRA